MYVIICYRSKYRKTLLPALLKFTVKIWPKIAEKKWVMTTPICQIAHLFALKCFTRLA